MKDRLLIKMMGRTHAFTGLFVGLLFTSTLSTTLMDKFLIVLIAIFSSLLPDIDSPKSIIGKKVPIVAILTKYRGVMHSIIPFAGIFFLTNYFVGFNYAFAFAIGFASHILLDVVTKEGISFWPLGIKIRGPVRVGGFLAHVFILCQILLMVLFFT